MISKRIEDFANTISFNLSEDSVYGFINDFLFSVYEKGNKKCFFVYFKLDETSSNDESPVSVMTLSKSLKEIFEKYGITDYSFKEDGLEVSIAISFKGFYSIMKATAKKLSEFKAVKKNICFSCENALSDQEKRFRYSKDFMNRLLCENCCKELSSDEVSEESDDEGNEEYENEFEDSNSYSNSRGFLGGTLFAFGISICLILLYAFVLPLPDPSSGFKPGYYVSWISAFIPVATIFGFKIFSKNEINTKIVLITGGISLAISIVSQYVSSIVLFARESVMVFENLTFERFSKMIPSLLKIPFTDDFVSPDFKIYVLMNSIFVVIALLIISFLIIPKAESEIIIEEI